MKRTKLLLIPALAACYASKPLRTSESPTGTRVVVTLTARGSEDVARVVGPNIVRIEGALARATTDSVELRMTRTERRDGIDALWQGERVAVARALVSGIETRRVSRARTWLLASGAALGAVALGAGFVGGHTPIVGTGGETGVAH